MVAGGGDIIINDLYYQYTSENLEKGLEEENIEDMVLQEFEKIPAYIESLNNKERLEFIIKLLPYAVPKYTHKTISDETPELPIFEQIQIVTSVDEKERLEKVEAYEKEHNVQIL